jgi:NADH-quinone oxidoreductase subunit G
MVGAGRARRRTAQPCWRWPRKLAGDFGAVTDGWNGFAVLQAPASRVGALDLGFVPSEGGLTVAADVAPGAPTCCSCSAPTKSRSQDRHLRRLHRHAWRRGAHRADVILPGAAYTEKSGLYVNTEGRVQMGNRAGFPPGDAREDWAMIRALSDVLGKKLPYDSLAALRGKLYAAHPHFAAIDRSRPVLAVDQLPPCTKGR